jgi:hypothetical protein
MYRLRQGSIRSEEGCRAGPERSSCEIRSVLAHEAVSRSTGLVLMSGRLDVWDIKI